MLFLFSGATTSPVAPQEIPVATKTNQKAMATSISPLQSRMQAAVSNKSKYILKLCQMQNNMRTQGNPSWTAVIKPLVSPGLWSQQNSMTVGLMPTLYASLTSEFRWFSSNDLTEVRRAILQSLQNLCSVAWQICLHVSFHLLRLEEGRRGVTWWFLAYLLAEHWEHRCCPFKIADLLLPQHAGFGGLPVSCGSDAQSSFPTSNLKRQQGRTRSSDKQNYLMGETSDCKKCIWLEGESCFQEWARCIRHSRKKILRKAFKTP